MIRVLQIGMTDTMGGIENFLINYYRSIDKMKIQFDFINIYDNDLCFADEIKKMGGKIYKVSSYYKHPIKYIKELIKIINNNDYSIIHCNMNSAVMLFPLIAGKLSNAKVVISHSHNSSSDKGFLKKILHNINKHFIPLFANRYFACSQVAGKWFFSNKIIKSEKFYILNNSIDISKFKFDLDNRKKIRKELNLSDDTFVVGHVGRFNKQKNHKYLLKLFSLFLKENSDSILLLIGIGPLLEEMKKLAIDLNINKSVIFLEQRKDVNILYNAMDIFVLPSLYEGLPLVGIEAQINGLPCLFSNKVTTELNISNNVEFLPIKNYGLFLEQLKNYRNKERKTIMNNTFDINECSKKLEFMYINMKHEVDIDDEFN